MSMRITLTPEEERAVADAYSRTWWLWLIAGILWLILGFIVLSLRPASITACVILIAIAFWLGGITQLALGFVLKAAGVGSRSSGAPSRSPPASPPSCGRSPRSW